MSLAVLALTVAAGLPAQETSASLDAEAAETWDVLAEEYERAFMTWAQEMSRSGGFSLPEEKRTALLAADYWPRFEAVARTGEGWAVVWMLRNRYGVEEEDLDRWSVALELFDRFVDDATDDDEWAVQALHALGDQYIGMTAREAAAFVARFEAPDRPRDLRVAALLVRAQLEEETDPDGAADTRQRAAFLRWHDVALSPGEEVLVEDVREIGISVIEAVEEEGGSWFERALREGDDGVYYERAKHFAQPREVWRPVIEVLAVRGSNEAREWALFNTWALTEESRATMRSHLDVLSEEGLDADGLRQLSYRVSSLSEMLGYEFVEPRVQKLIDGADDDLAPGLLLGLAEGLCETAGEDAARKQRGLALMREVLERWPESDAAESVAGKLFRYERLAVGMPCPDFETVDADGVAFKLSDYKGKVTVIDFWGFW